MTERTQIAEEARKLQQELAESRGIVTSTDARRLARLVERLADVDGERSDTAKEG
jgi:hypothetical protein